MASLNSDLSSSAYLVTLDLFLTQNIMQKARTFIKALSDILRSQNSRVFQLCLTFSLFLINNITCKPLLSSEEADLENQLKKEIYMPLCGFQKALQQCIISRPCNVNCNPTERLSQRCIPSCSQFVYNFHPSVNIQHLWACYNSS